MLKDYKNNLKNLHEKIKSCCEVAGRNPDDILLIAASKYASIDQVKEVAELGIKDFGENRAEELEKKYEKIGTGLNWHFIGHLQRRKVKVVVPIAQYIHSVDSIDLAEKINSEALKISKVQKILVEINISGETTKFGIKPDMIWDFLNAIASYKNICTCGLMTMAPLTDDENLIRSTFSDLKILLNNISKEPYFFMISELSMGMSNDYKIAIQEGATMLRIGSLIFV